MNSSKCDNVHMKPFLKAASDIRTPKEPQNLSLYYGRAYDISHLVKKKIQGSVYKRKEQRASSIII